MSIEQITAGQAGGYQVELPNHETKTFSSENEAISFLEENGIDPNNCNITQPEKDDVSIEGKEEKAPDAELSEEEQQALTQWMGQFGESPQTITSAVDLIKNGIQSFKDLISNISSSLKNDNANYKQNLEKGINGIVNSTMSNEEMAQALSKLSVTYDNSATMGLISQAGGLGSQINNELGGLQNAVNRANQGLSLAAGFFGKNVGEDSISIYNALKGAVSTGSASYDTNTNLNNTLGTQVQDQNSDMTTVKSQSENYGKEKISAEKNNLQEQSQSEEAEDDEKEKVGV